MISMEKIKKYYSSHISAPIGKHRFFSVLVPFVEKDGQLFLMFEQRAMKMISQPGEICFPGGALEEGETAIECAFRETEEETGIDRTTIEIFGEGDRIEGYANYTLYTVIGKIPYDKYLEANINKEEVERIFLIPFESFENSAPEDGKYAIYTDVSAFPYERTKVPKDYPWRKGEWNIPAYHIDGTIIWGLTANIIKNMTKQLGEVF